MSSSGGNSIDRETIQGIADDSYDFEAMLEEALKNSGQDAGLPPPQPPSKPQSTKQPLAKSPETTTPTQLEQAALQPLQQAKPATIQTPTTTQTPAAAPATEADLGFDPSILEQPIAQRLQNRNFKVKVHAAKCITQKIKEGDFPPEKAELEGLVKMTSDSAPLSQEAGLTTLDAVFTAALNDPAMERAKVEGFMGMKEALKVDVLATSLIEKCLGNARQKTREQGLTILLYLIQIDEQETVTEALIKGTKHRIPKVVLGSVLSIRTILSEFGPRQFPVDKFMELFEGWFSHRDSEVRKEAQNFLVELYRWNEGGQKEMAQLITPLKPAQKKDIEEAFAQVTEFKSTPKRLTWAARKAKEAEEEEKRKSLAAGKKRGAAAGAGSGAQGGGAGQPLRLGKPINLLKDFDHDKFSEVLASGKWMEKRDELQRVIDKLNTGTFLDPQGDYSHLVIALRTGLGEVNLAVRTKYAEALGLLAARLYEGFAPYARTVVSALFLSFKEKKPQYVATVHNALDQIAESSPILPKMITKFAQADPTQIEPNVDKLCAPFKTTITHENSEVRELTGKCINALQEFVPEAKISAALKGTSDPKRLEKILERSGRHTKNAPPPPSSASTLSSSTPRSGSTTKSSTSTTPATTTSSLSSSNSSQLKNSSRLASQPAPQQAKKPATGVTRSLRRATELSSSSPSPSLQPPQSSSTASALSLSKRSATTSRQKPLSQAKKEPAPNAKKPSEKLPPAVPLDQGPYNITAKIPAKVAESINNSDWSVRQESLNEVARIIRVDCHSNLKPVLGTLPNLLRTRLVDSNKGVVRATLGVLYELAVAIRKPNFEKLGKSFYPTVLQILGDGAKQNRDDALRCAQAFADNMQLAATLSASAAALVGEKDSPALRREVLAFLNERLATAEAAAAGPSQEFSSAGDGLQAIIRPALACAIDKQGDVRKLAETTLSVVAKRVPYASFEPHLERYAPSQKSALENVLAKFYGSIGPKASALAKSARRVPAKASVSQRITAPDTRPPSKARKEAQSLLLVDSAQKAGRSKSKAFYDAKLLGSVAGRQNLRDCLRNGVLADPSATAQMFSQDPSVLAQALAEFAALVSKFPAPAANSSDLLVLWCVTAVIGDVEDNAVYANSFTLLNKVLENLESRNEPLLGHEVFAIAHGLPHYFAHGVALDEFADLLIRLCPAKPFLPLKYATEALEVVGGGCVPLLESISLLVAAYQRKKILHLVYGDNPAFAQIVSQYALSKDAAVSRPAQTILAMLHGETDEQPIACIASNKAGAAHEFTAPSSTNSLALTTTTSKFTEEELESMGKGIEQALSTRDFGGLVRRVTALHQVLSAAIADGAPPPPHVYDAEGLLLAMARVVPIMLRDPKIEVPVTGALRTLNACLKRGYLDLRGLSQECVSALVRALLFHKNEELHRGLVILFKLGNPFRVSVGLVQLARSTIATAEALPQPCAQAALGLLDEAALLCARAADPERGGLSGLLSELRSAITESMVNEKPPYEVAKACVRMLRTIHAGNSAVTERLCRNVQVLTAFLDDGDESDGKDIGVEVGVEVVKENINSGEDYEYVERSHTPLGQMPDMKN